MIELCTLFISNRIDYNVAEVYSPTLKIDSLRVLLSTSAVYLLELSQLDVKTAFLYGDLDEELCVEQPEGFREAGTEHLVCRLKKPLYGLIQLARKWNEKFYFFISKFGLTRSSSDPCIYFYQGDTADDLTLFGIWVDDGILATKKKETASAIIQHLEKFFEMKSKLPNLFIGLEITRDRKQKKIFVSQTNYIESLLQKFHMAGCHPSTVPADPSSRLSVNDCPTRSSKTPLLSTPYSSAEDQYYAAGHASREIAWLRSLRKEIGLEKVEPTPLMCDNSSAIMMVHNPVFHNRTKHIDIKYHYVRQQYKAKNVELLHIPSKDELADMLTKPLRSQELHQNRLRVGVIQVTHV